MSIKKDKALFNKVYREAAVYFAMTKQAESTTEIEHVDLDQEPFLDELKDAGLMEIVSYIEGIEKNIR